MVGKVGIEQRRDTLGGGWVDDTVHKQTSFKATAVTCNTNVHHTCQETTAADKGDITETNIASTGEVHYITGVRSGIGIQYCFVFRVERLEDNVVLCRMTIYLGQCERWVRTGAEFNHQRVAYTAAAQGEEQFLDGVVVGILTSNLAHTGKTSIADNELLVAGVVVRFMVAIEAPQDRQTIFDPSPNKMEACGEGQVAVDSDGYRIAACQTAVPIKVVTDAVVNAVTNPHGVYSGHAIVV